MGCFSSAEEVGKAAGGGEPRRRAPEVGEKGASVGDLAGAWVCELRGSSGEVVRASIQPEEGYGEVSAEECQWRRRSYVFRRLQGSDGQTKARMSIRGLGGSSQWVWPAKNVAVVCCPR